MTKVVNCKNNSYDIYIGRGSKWGNPFSHLKNSKSNFKVKTRKEAIEKYENWIVSGDGKDLLIEIETLRDKVLGCWCKPKECHGDILVKILNNVSLF